MSEATYYTWKKKSGNLGVTELKRPKMLEVETHRGRPDAGQTDHAGGRPKKALKAVKRRELAAWMQERFKVNVRRSRRLALLRPSVWHATSEARDQSARRLRSREIAMDRPRFSYLRLLVMRKREGWKIGKKRAYRLYRLEGLQLCMKVKRRKRISLQLSWPTPATGPNQSWSMDLVHDQMLYGRASRSLTVINQCNREIVTLEANFQLTGRCVAKPLEEDTLERGWPKAITVDNSTEFASKAFDEFITMQDAREKFKAWQHHNNYYRPHGSLGNLTPREFVRKRADQQPKSGPTLV